MSTTETSRNSYTLPSASKALSPMRPSTAHTRGGGSGRGGDSDSLRWLDEACKRAEENPVPARSPRRAVESAPPSRTPRRPLAAAAATAAAVTAAAPSAAPPACTAATCSALGSDSSELASTCTKDDNVEWAPPLLSLVGMTPKNERIHQSCLGCFERRGQLVNGRVSYAQCAGQGASSTLLWYSNSACCVGFQPAPRVASSRQARFNERCAVPVECRTFASHRFLVCRAASLARQVLGTRRRTVSGDAARPR